LENSFSGNKEYSARNNICIFKNQEAIHALSTLLPPALPPNTSTPHSKSFSVFINSIKLWKKQLQ